MGEPRDTVQRIIEQWEIARPDLDSSPIGVVGRVHRLARLLDQRLAENFARHGIEAWMYDLLATLRRSEPPHELTAGELLRASMVTSGAITNRIDRLEQRGWVERRNAADRRKVLVRLTADGKALVDTVVVTHLATETDALALLSERDRAELTRVLRRYLAALGDTPG